MKQCPVCGRYMNFHMEYNCGYPQIFYTCSCGYDTRVELKTIWTTDTSGTSVPTLIDFNYNNSTTAI